VVSGQQLEAHQQGRGLRRTRFCVLRPRLLKILKDTPPSPSLTIDTVGVSHKVTHSRSQKEQSLLGLSVHEPEVVHLKVEHQRLEIETRENIFVNEQ
jgi:hypothetical protein